MTNLIVELSKYALILLMALYTCMTFVSFRMKTRKSSDVMLAEMTFMMLLLQFVATGPQCGTGGMAESANALL